MKAIRLWPGWAAHAVTRAAWRSVRWVEQRAAHHLVAHFLDKVLRRHRHLPGRMEADRSILGVEEVHRELQHNIALKREPAPDVPNGLYRFTPYRIVEADLEEDCRLVLAVAVDLAQVGDVVVPVVTVGSGKPANLCLILAVPSLENPG